MPAIDLVTANEFTFTPSAFIAAYIENNKEEFNTTETTVNGGKLKTLPGDDGVADSNVITAILEANKLVAEASKVPGFPPEVQTVETTTVAPTGIVGGIASPGQASTSAAAAGGVSGVSPGATGPLTLNGAVVDLIGQTANDTRTVAKTVTKTYQLSVVLVLSYGTFKSPALDRAGALATVAAIHAQVQNYLNSL